MPIGEQVIRALAYGTVDNEAGAVAKLQQASKFSKTPAGRQLLQVADVMQRAFPTDGTGRFKHPRQEAAAAIVRLEQQARSVFDEFVVLRFDATNASPFPFTWVDAQQKLLEYSAALTRLSRLYEQRFRPRPM